MWRYLLRRLPQSIVVLYSAVPISCALMNVFGKPVDAIGGPFMTAERRDSLDEQVGYNRPLHARFVDYLGGVLQGDCDLSYRTNPSAPAEVMRALSNTLILVLAGWLLAG